MDKATPATRTCAVCRGQLRSSNRVGICTTKAECIRERASRARHAHEASLRRRGRKKCQHLDDCPNYAWAFGWCRMHWRRVEKNGDPGPVGRVKRREPQISAGDVIGTWTVLKNYGRDGTVLPVRCECGNERLVSADALLRWGNKPCVCHRKGKPLGRPMTVSPGKQPYLAAGTVFGRLTLLEDVYFCHDRVRCTCECGNEAKPKANSLKFGVTRSCGCIQRERRITHGLSKHPLYQTWYSMVDRCTNPDARNWEGYGGRGIKVCDRWLGLPEGLQNFIADMGPKPTPEYSLDRTDVEGNYEPGNCAWETAKVQAHHRRSIAELTRERNALLVRVADLEAALIGKATLS
jgi:hypothetical protein